VDGILPISTIYNICIKVGEDDFPAKPISIVKLQAAIAHKGASFSNSVL
jgi:hypothetical protein